MAFNGVGVYIPPVPPDFPAVTGQTIQAPHYNTVVNDIATALTKCVTRDGQTPIQANLPMTGFKHTGVANAVAADEYMAYGQFGATLDSQLEAKIEAMTRLEFKNSFLNISNNLTYVDPNWTYSADGAASLIFFDRLNGVISFYTAVSGTAGNIATLIKTGGFGNNVASFKPSVHYIEPSVGARSTLFDVNANIGAAWESVGYTGSGATNIWTAMDGLGIINATYVEIRGSIYAYDAAGSGAESLLYGRTNGDTSAISGYNVLADAYIDVTGGTGVYARNWFSAKIPLTSGKFDLYFSKSDSAGCSIYVCGCGT